MGFERHVTLASSVFLFFCLAYLVGMAHVNEHFFAIDAM